MRILLIRCHVPVDPIPAMMKEKKSIDLNGLDDYLTELAKRVRDHHGD